MYEVGVKMKKTEATLEEQYKSMDNDADEE